MAELIALVARIVRTVVFLLIFLALLMVGLCVFAVVLIVSLLRGRRPRMPTVGVFRQAQDFRAQAFGQRPAPTGDIVDVEAREVPNQHPRLDP